MPTRNLSGWPHPKAALGDGPEDIWGYHTGLKIPSHFCPSPCDGAFYLVHCFFPPPRDAAAPCAGFSWYWVA